MSDAISNTNTKLRILLIGDMTGAFTDSTPILQAGYKHCDCMDEAISMAAKEDFETVFIVMSEFKGRLESPLKNLRRVSKNAKIILLARMYEEPKARQLTSAKGDIINIADDYYIRPADIKISGGNGRIAPAFQVPTIRPVKIDYRDNRIAQLERLATEDDLTGLKNRRYVREFLRQIIIRAESEKLPVTLFVFDIDDFKHYNDRYGHAVGDEVLKQAATMMRRCCRTHDIIGRIGGDEFAVVFWDCPADIKKKGPSKAENERRGNRGEHPHKAVVMSERFRKQISSTDLSLLGTKGKGKLTISGGLASFPEDGSKVKELFEKADQAMLEAKRSGKNQIYLVGNPD